MTSAVAPPPPELTLPAFADPYAYRRRRTRAVAVGAVGIGGRNPIRLQSMTDTPTRDVDATVAQAAALVAAGCEIVRVTTPSVEDARALRGIRAGLLAQGIRVPLVADVHFSPAVALEAAEWADKVRINPGNFADTKAFRQREYSDAEWERALARIAEVFTPLVRKLSRLGRALRIGTNHGSLSDRILNRLGDTPAGMVESALEYARICARLGFHQLVFSMKASNPKVMVQAYRLLAARMSQEGMDYPFHLGVTEAGAGEDGRVKSAVGIGSLLADGLGDTIRVSLTEPPEREIPVAAALAAPFRERPDDGGLPGPPRSFPADPFSYSRRATREAAIGPVRVGGEQPPRLFLRRWTDDPQATMATLARLARDGEGGAELLGWPCALPGELSSLSGLRRARDRSGAALGLVGRIPAASDAAHVARAAAECDALEVSVSAGSEWPAIAAAAASGRPLLLVGTDPDLLSRLALEAERGGAGGVLLGIESEDDLSALHAYRALAARHGGRPDAPALLLIAPHDPDPLRRQLRSAQLLGSLLCDGIGDAVAVPAGDPASAAAASYAILQATGRRITRAEFVSCPGCGRTLFELQGTTEKIRARTGHLTGVRIAVMGCIVNGPGEMADADFGYVGGAPGQINLYVGKDCVERGIPEERALEAMESLIRSRGRWVDPVPAGPRSPEVSAR